MTGDGSSSQHDGELARITTIVLAEFAGLYSEKATRISILYTLILGNLTVLGVVLAIALSRSGNMNVLLLIPLVTPCIELLVIDGFRNLGLLDRYISRVIRPQLQIKSQLKFEDIEVFEWERWLTKHQFTLGLAIPFQFVLAAEFLAPPIAALIFTINYYFQHPQVQFSALQRGLWVTGAVLTGVSIIFAALYARYPLWHRQGSKNIGSGRTAR